MDQPVPMVDPLSLVPSLILPLCIKRAAVSISLEDGFFCAGKNT